MKLFDQVQQVRVVALQLQSPRFDPELALLPRVTAFVGCHMFSLCGLPLGSLLSTQMDE